MAKVWTGRDRGTGLLHEKWVTTRDFGRRREGLRPKAGVEIQGGSRVTGFGLKIQAIFGGGWILIFGDVSDYLPPAEAT